MPASRKRVAKKNDIQAPSQAETGLFRVLVVEDEPHVMAYYQQMLSQEKFAFDLCLNGHAALEKLSTTPYGLVITDLNLPGLDGISLLRWTQRHRPATTSVVISGDGSAEVILAAMRAGARDYLVKPFPPAVFQEMIKRWAQPRHTFNSEVFSSLMQQVMHDVRGELVNLDIMIKLLQGGKSGDMDAGVKDVLVAMQGKLEQLKGLTADYCFLSANLLRSDGDIPTERIALQGEVISQILAEMQNALHSKAIHVSCSQDLAIEGDAYVMGNRLMLQSVFRTLFSNAIKHCRTTGVLSYGITSNNRRYKIQVSNEGDTVPAHLQAGIFDEFVQGKPSASSAGQQEGLGLGLALAKDILRQHNGDIWYEPLANGSKFVCTLPVMAK